MVEEHHPDENSEGKDKIQESREDRGKRNQYTGKINFGDYFLKLHQTQTPLIYSMREVIPGNQSSVSKYRVGDTLGGNTGKFTEEYAEDHHGEERLENCPANAQKSLFVFNLYISPDKEVEQFSIFPDFS